MDTNSFWDIVEFREKFNTEEVATPGSVRERGSNVGVKGILNIAINTSKRVCS